MSRRLRAWVVQLQQRRGRKVFAVAAVVVACACGTPVRTPSTEDDTEGPIVPKPPEPEPEPVCGNAIIEYEEFCDDGNVDDGDDCPATCRLEGGSVVEESLLEVASLFPFDAGAFRVEDFGTDAAGNLYLGGTREYDRFSWGWVGMLDVAGASLWQVQFGSEAVATEILHVSVRPVGGVVVVGRTFDPLVGYTAWLAAYDERGRRTWRYDVEGIQPWVTTRPALFHDGAVLAAILDEEFALGSVLLELDGAGQLVRQLEVRGEPPGNANDGQAFTYVTSVAVDANDGVYLSGIGLRTLTPSMGWIRHGDREGTVAWDRYSTSVTEYHALAVDGIRIVAAGITDYSQTGTAIVHALDKQGTLVWERALSSDLAYMRAAGVAINRNGAAHVVVGGIGREDEQWRCRVVRLHPSRGSMAWSSVFDAADGPNVAFIEHCFGVTLDPLGFPVAGASTTQDLIHRNDVWLRRLAP